MSEDAAMFASLNLPQPKVPCHVTTAKGGETFMLGNVRIRVMEDGSHTDNRIGTAEFTIPPQTRGPPAHWHEMHDETFLVTQGTVRFHLPASANPSLARPEHAGKAGEDVHGETHVDAHEGDYVTVPIRAPHTFSNPFDDEAKFINTFTPAFYINYFRIIGKLMQEGKPMDPEINKKAMTVYATIVADLSK